MFQFISAGTKSAVNETGLRGDKTAQDPYGVFLIRSLIKDLMVYYAGLRGSITRNGRQYS